MRGRLTSEPIDVAALSREAAADECGAVVTFVGTVRAERDDDGDEVVALEYVAYDAMAVAKLCAVCDAAVARFAIRQAVCVHRVGLLRIGEASVAIAVAAPHRADAFAAAGHVIDTIKQVVPIWKKDIYRSGRTQWVDPTKSREHDGSKEDKEDKEKDIEENV